MVVTDTNFVNRQGYQCEFDDGKRINSNRHSYIIAKLESLCYGCQWFQMYVGIGVSVNLVSLICCLLYRIRHHLGYIYIKARLNRQKFKQPTDHGKYTFNAFVLCDRRDCKWFVKRRLLPILETEETKLKFLVAQRDFIVGATITDNIMKSVNRRKIIFIFSQYFLESGWCKEELRIAQWVCLSFMLYYLIFMFFCTSCCNYQTSLSELTYF